MNMLSCDSRASLHSSLWRFEIMKNGTIVDTIPLDCTHQNTFRIGRHPEATFVANHPTVSRCHACIYWHKDTNTITLVDEQSTHGTWVNKRKIQAHHHVQLMEGDHVKFGESTRTYVLEGPSQTEKNAKNESTKHTTHIQKTQQQWDEKDVDVDVDVDVDEQLIRTEEGLKLKNIHTHTHLSTRKRIMLEKYHAKKNKLQNVQSEMERIKEKEEKHQLTDGQRQQLHRLEMRINQIGLDIEKMEENMIELFNTHRETNTRKVRNEQGAAANDDDSDDDDFYDRTKVHAKKNSNENIMKSTIAITEIEHINNEDDIDKEMQCVLNRRKLLQGILRDLTLNIDSSRTISSSSDALDVFMASLQNTVASDRKQLVKAELRMLQISYEKLKQRREILRGEKRAAELQLSSKDSSGISYTVPISHSNKSSDHLQLSGMSAVLKRARELDEATKSQTKAASASTCEENTQYVDTEVVKPPVHSIKALPPESVVEQGVPDYIQKLAVELESKRQKRTSQVGVQEKVQQVLDSGSGGLVVAKPSHAAVLPHHISNDFEPQIDDEISEYELNWHPPSSQTGDGRTNLNIKLGY